MINSTGFYSLVNSAVGGYKRLAEATPTQRNSFQQRLLGMLSSGRRQSGTLQGSTGADYGTAQLSPTEPAARDSLSSVKTTSSCHSAEGQPIQETPFTFLDATVALTAGSYVDPQTREEATFAVNPLHFAERETAEYLAELLGGTVETLQVSGAYSGPPEYMVRVGNYLGSAGLIANTYMRHPTWLADKIIQSEIASANSVEMDS